LSVAEAGIGAGGEGLAIVADQVAEFGGVERIAEVALTRFPAASLYAGGFDPSPGFPADDLVSRLRERGVAIDRPAREGAALRLVRAGGRRRHYLAPLYAHRMRAARLEGARTVLSLGAMAWSLAVEVPSGARHVGYVGGRPRPYYEHASRYLLEYPRPVRPLLRAAMPALRRHHRLLLRRPHELATNSIDSARALEPIVGARPRVLYPPVRTDFFTPGDGPGRHYLAVARLRWHKRLDLVVEAFRQLGEPLVVAGEGPILDELRRAAPPNVEFAGQLNDSELRDLYRSSRALVSASVEEFGLCLAEAQSAGIPVVAPNAGGARESVRHGETGILVDEVSAESLAAAVRGLDAAPIDPAACRRYAMRFSEERFAAGLDSMLAGAAKLAS
jgi:glycosyltransferase involved in cell wall biosynthesis